VLLPPDVLGEPVLVVTDVAALLLRDLAVLHRALPLLLDLALLVLEPLLHLRRDLARVDPARSASPRGSVVTQNAESLPAVRFLIVRQSAGDAPARIKLPATEKMVLFM